mmetsp:Transcript_26687/g.48455  ORF Transcript_26687/g.48455 Transcript_26687/m.48455 type:complete len:162 (+) Transcript_26687:62-547(+)
MTLVISELLKRHRKHYEKGWRMNKTRNHHHVGLPLMLEIRRKPNKKGWGISETGNHHHTRLPRMWKKIHPKGEGVTILPPKQKRERLIVQTRRLQVLLQRKSRLRQSSIDKGTNGDVKNSRLYADRQHNQCHRLRFDNPFRTSDFSLGAMGDPLRGNNHTR